MAIPIKTGLRYYLGNFYGGFETGLVFQRNYNAGEQWLCALSLGDEIVTRSNGNSLDISLRYERWGVKKYQSLVGLRLAYEFRIN